MKYKINTIYTVLLVMFLFGVSGNLHSQENWKDKWNEVIVELDSVFYPVQRHFRLMQSYQNDADSSKITGDIDSLQHFKSEINRIIPTCNSLYVPLTDEGDNARETIRLKNAAIYEYFEQCYLQLQVNNSIIQKRLKNEYLDFKVSEISGILSELIKYEPYTK